MNSIKFNNVHLLYSSYSDVFYPEDNINHTEEYIDVCGFCPENYPWLDNPLGE